MDPIEHAYEELRILLGDLLAAWPEGKAAEIVAAAAYWLRHHCSICARPLSDREADDVPICAACWSGHPRRGGTEDAGEVPF